jgi:hypothetical protein
MSGDPKNGPDAAEDASVGTAPPATEPEAAQTAADAGSGAATAASADGDSASPYVAAAAGAAASYAAGGQSAYAARNEPVYDEPAEPRSSKPLTRALAVLGLVLGGGLAALSLAPNLPAPVAAFFAVPSAGADPALQARLSALGADLASTRQAADTALAAVSGATSRLADMDAALAALDSRIGAASGGGDPAVAQRLAEAEQALAALRGEFAALAATVIDGGGAGGAASVDYEARLAALEAGQKDELEWRAKAVEQADAARRYASVTAALGQIDRAMTLGAPFPDALDALIAAAGEQAPEALVKAAADGAPTREALKATFPTYAHEAIEAALVGEASEDDGALAGILARVQARVTGLPTEAVQGDSAPAVLSRARVALFNGDIDAALAAIAALPAPSQAAMTDWVAGATLRAEADAALAAWRADLASGL